MYYHSYPHFSNFGLKSKVNSVLQAATLLKIDQRQVIEDLSKEEDYYRLDYDDLQSGGISLVRRFYIYHEQTAKSFTLIKFEAANLVDFEVVDPVDLCYRAQFKINVLNPNNLEGGAYFEYELSVTQLGITWMAYG